MPLPLSAEVFAVRSVDDRNVRYYDASGINVFPADVRDIQLIEIRDEPALGKLNHLFNQAYNQHRQALVPNALVDSESPCSGS